MIRRPPRSTLFPSPPLFRSLWALLAAPLLAGNDLRSMTAAAREILTNREVIAVDHRLGRQGSRVRQEDRKSTRLNSSHSQISYAVFCLKKKTETRRRSLPLQ